MAAGYDVIVIGAGVSGMYQLHRLRGLGLRVRVFDAGDGVGGTSPVLVRPQTVVWWHRQGFRGYWAWKSRRRRGRPPIGTELRDLIRRMSGANPLWGAPRIHGELLKLGLTVSQAAVSKYMLRPRKPPSQTWRSLLKNHAKDLIGLDFFTVPTATFRVLFVLVVLNHGRRPVGAFQCHGTSDHGLD